MVSKWVRRRVQKTLTLKCEIKKSLQQIFTTYISICSPTLMIFVSWAWQYCSWNIDQNTTCFSSLVPFISSLHFVWAQTSKSHLVLGFVIPGGTHRRERNKTTPPSIEKGNQIRAISLHFSPSQLPMGQWLAAGVTKQVWSHQTGACGLVLSSFSHYKEINSPPRQMNTSNKCHLPVAMDVFSQGQLQILRSSHAQTSTSQKNWPSLLPGSLSLTSEPRHIFLGHF